jgi:hypothetical protein
MTAALPMSDSRIPTDTMWVGNPALLTVIDCPRCAWRDFGATQLGSFGSMHRERLDEAARELIRRPLIEAWRRRGFRVQLVCHHDCAADPGAVDDPPDEVFIAVRQEAADAVEDAELVFAAGLTDEYRRGEQ